MDSSSRSSIVPALLICYVLLIIYASVSPFGGWRAPDSPVFAYLAKGWPKYVTRFDLIVNVLAYAPIGFLACAYVAKFRSTAAALALSVGGATLLSLVLETVQVFVPSRIASNVDLAANCFGAIIGALAALWLGKYTVLESELLSMRRRLFFAGHSVDVGLVLLIVWLISQLNPSVPILAAGLVDPQPPDELGAFAQGASSEAPFAAGTALNFCGVGLLVTVLTRSRAVALVVFQALIAAAFSLKMLAAEAMLKPQLVSQWRSHETLIGLAIGFLLLLPLCLFALRTRIYLAAVVVLAGAMLSKLAGHYASLSSALQLFNWPYGQLMNFAGLTLYLNEIWPVAALIFLLLYQLRHRPAPQPAAEHRV